MHTGTKCHVLRFLLLSILERVVNNGILLTIASVIVTILSKIPFIGWIIGLILGIGLFVLWLLAIIAAIQGNKYKFPFIGDSLVFIK